MRTARRRAPGIVSDSLQRTIPDSGLRVGGTEPGSDDVPVPRPGYAVWTRTQVAVVQVGTCGNVEPVQLDARLPPAP